MTSFDVFLLKCMCQVFGFVVLRAKSGPEARELPSIMEERGPDT
jgi:hypothetical protein